MQRQTARSDRSPGRSRRRCARGRAKTLFPGTGANPRAGGFPGPDRAANQRLFGCRRLCLAGLPRRSRLCGEQQAKGKMEQLVHGLGRKGQACQGILGSVFARVEEDSAESRPLGSRSRPTSPIATSAAWPVTRPRSPRPRMTAGLCWPTASVARPATAQPAVGLPNTRFAPGTRPTRGRIATRTGRRRTRTAGW